MLFALSLPSSLRSDGRDEDAADRARRRRGGRSWLAVGLLAAASVLAAFVSDWFVEALEPAMEALGISEAFAGLVIVAIAGNAVENVVGIQLAAKDQSEYAFSVMLNSPMQIALVLAPALVSSARSSGWPA